MDFHFQRMVSPWTSSSSRCNPFFGTYCEYVICSSVVYFVVYLVLVSLIFLVLALLRFTLHGDVLAPTKDVGFFL